MKHIFSKKSQIGLWVAIFVFLLLFSGSTQNCNAQFGLFDTVWTMNGLAENHTIIKSPNDSLIILWTLEKPGNLDRYRLYNTLTKQLIWDSTLYRIRFILSDNRSLVTWDTNKIIIRDLYTLEPISTVVEESINLTSCHVQGITISEIDTSIYYAETCGHGSLKGVSYKVNYRTGKAMVTETQLPYFALTISEDGQYVAGVYYESDGGYYEIIEVRKISDYSLVFRDRKYYSDYTPNFDPTAWVGNYKFIFSKDDRYLIFNHINNRLFDLKNSKEVELYDLPKNNGYLCTDFTNDSKKLFFFYITYQNGFKIKNIQIVNIDLEKVKMTFFDYPLDSMKLFVGGGSLVLDDNHILTLGTNILDKDFNNLGTFADISLLKLNFDLNTVQEPPPIYQGILYPNPTTDYITVSFVNPPVNRWIDAIEIYNIFWECIITTPSSLCYDTPQEGNLRIDVSALPPGVYFVKIGLEKPNKFIKL